LVRASLVNTPSASFVPLVFLGKANSADCVTVSPGFQANGFTPGGPV